MESRDSDSCEAVPGTLDDSRTKADDVEDDDGEGSSRSLLRAIVAAAWPQSTVVACRNLVDLTDVAVLGWLGTDELAAAAFAQVVIALTGAVLWQGAGDALIALVSQSIGADNHKLAGIWLQTSLVSICVASIPIAAMWWFTGDILALTGASEHVRVLSLIHI